MTGTVYGGQVNLGRPVCTVECLDDLVFIRFQVGKIAPEDVWFEVEIQSHGEEGAGDEDRLAAGSCLLDLKVEIFGLGNNQRQIF